MDHLGRCDDSERVWTTARGALQLSAVHVGHPTIVDAAALPPFSVTRRPN
jgi:hypothetical protein